MLRNTFIRLVTLYIMIYPIALSMSQRRTEVNGVITKHNSILSRILRSIPIIHVSSFVTTSVTPKTFTLMHPLLSVSDEESSELSTYDDAFVEQATKFTLKVCTSSKCSRALGRLGYDEYAVLSSLSDYASSSGVNVDDSGCLGWCKRGPSVAVEHEDYEGRVGLEGMRDTERAQKCFFGVGEEGEGGRGWGVVEEGIRMMVEEEED